MACASVTTSEMMLNCGSTSRRCGATVRAPRHLATLDGLQNNTIISTVNSHLSNISLFTQILCHVITMNWQKESSLFDAFSKSEYIKVMTGCLSCVALWSYRWLQTYQRNVSLLSSGFVCSNETLVITYTAWQPRRPQLTYQL
jgi:hypothetical protein